MAVLPLADGLPAMAAHPQRLGHGVLREAEGLAGGAEVSGGQAPSLSWYE